MSEVKRYTVHYYDGAGEIQDGDGEYVYFSDYDALRTELDETKAALADAELDGISKSLEIKQRCEEIDALRTELEQLKRFQADGLGNVIDTQDGSVYGVGDLAQALKERDDAVKALEVMIRYDENEYDKAHGIGAKLCECEWCNNFRQAKALLTRIKGETT